MRLFITAGFTLLLSCKSPEIATKVTQVTNDELKIPTSANGYKVTRIDSIKTIDSLNTIYLIYTKRDGIIYQIVSDKVAVENCNQILVGKWYKFNLSSLYFTDLDSATKVNSIPLATAGNLHSAGVDWDGKGTLIKLETDSITDMYYAKNLTGLCLNDY